MLKFYLSKNWPLIWKGGNLAFCLFTIILIVHTYREIGELILFDRELNFELFESPIRLEWAIFSFILSQILLAEILLFSCSLYFIRTKFFQISGSNFWDFSFSRFMCINSALTGISVGGIYFVGIFFIEGQIPSGWKYPGAFMAARPYMGIVHVFIVSFFSFPEELYFRGVCFSFFRKSLGVLASSVISSILFVAAHTQTLSDPIQTIPIFLFGIFQCIVLARTTTIIPIIIIHVFANLTIGGLSYNTWV